ncbi:MAG: c-type cytochrome [Proteobacteria bacterium]|nr:c-type cytochrome [Pseudomonadota bacterium]
MKKALMRSIVYVFALVVLIPATALTTEKTEKLKIEGLISPASPKALIAAVEASKKIKVIDLNLKDTETGWPELIVSFDSAVITLEAIEELIASTKDPAGQHYKVHKGPLLANADLTEEEIDAISKLGSTPPPASTLTNPISRSEESVGKGKDLFQSNCSKCHGLRGNGYGTAAHGLTTWPRQLFAWNNADSSIDGYLFQFITYGNTDMPPWGLILSENDRWNLINYIKTMEAPVFN